MHWSIISRYNSITYFRIFSVSLSLPNTARKQSMNQAKRAKSSLIESKTKIVIDPIYYKWYYQPIVLFFLAPFNFDKALLILAIRSGILSRLDRSQSNKIFFKSVEYWGSIDLTFLIRRQNFRPGATSMTWPYSASWRTTLSVASPPYGCNYGWYDRSLYEQVI